jgi:hypothetical protein
MYGADVYALPYTKPLTSPAYTDWVGGDDIRYSCGVAHT